MRKVANLLGKTSLQAYQYPQGFSLLSERPRQGLSRMSPLKMSQDHHHGELNLSSLE